MPNEITNNSAIIGPVTTDPVLSTVNSESQQQISKRRLRAQDSVNVLRVNVTSQGRLGNASSRAVTMNGGSAQSRGASSPVRISSVDQGNTSLSANTRPILSLPEFDIPAPISNLSLADSATLETGFNQNGQQFSLLTRADGTSQESIYSFFPQGRNGAPGGHRVDIMEYDNRGREQSHQAVSVLINSIGNDIYNATAVDLTDPANPIQLYNSTLRATDLIDDDARQLFNSDTTYPDGTVISKEHQAVDTSTTAYDPQFTSAYRTTITSNTPGSSARVLETRSITDEQGFRITTVSDISDQVHPVLISTDRKYDPFVLSERFSGVQLNNYIDHIDQQGFLNITGSNKATVELDLILIHRFNKGKHGAELFANLDLSGATNTQEQIEAKLTEGFAREIYDIDGSGSQNKIAGLPADNPVNEFDMDFLARYMVGARNSALTDRRFADDDSINIAADGSNIIALNNDSPILAEIQEIFGVDGVSLNSGANDLKLFYINLAAGASFDGSSGRVTRSVQLEANGARRNREFSLEEGISVSDRPSARTITRLGDLSTGFFDDLDL